MSDAHRDKGIRGDLAKLYDVFVDWPGRLSREIPGLTRRLHEAGAGRVLDVGCGTGRHVQALRQHGFDTDGADVSDDMLTAAAALLDGSSGLHRWRLGDDPPASLKAAAPFDAIVCLGNVWPAITTDAQVQAACRSMLDLLQPGGIVVLGLKAVACRRDAGDPYMPLLKRTHEGRPIFFIRAVDFDVPGGAAEGTLCDLHMIVVRGGGDEPAEHVTSDLHEVRRVRAWSPAELELAFNLAGFQAVHVSAAIGDTTDRPTGEDVFVHARRP